MDFDSIYQNHPHRYGTEPSQWIVKILEYRQPPAKVLDLGICQGRNALFLAKQGYTVIGVDISKVAIEQCQTEARKFGLAIDCYCQDLNDYIFESMFDVIYSTMTLQYVGGLDKAESIIMNMKSHTNAHGLNVISVPSDTRVALEFAYYFHREQLLRYYQDWEILESGESKDRFTNGKTGTIVHVIARRSH